jgi:hypothetical protein
MSDAVLAAIMVAVFLLAIGLIRLLDRMISRDADPDGFADKPPDTGEAPDGGADRLGRPR